MAGLLRLSSWLIKNWFLVGILLAVAAGIIIPQAGNAVSQGGGVANTLVVALFFLSGLSLPTENLRVGLSDIRQHLFLQSFIFIVVPLYFMATVALLWSNADDQIVTGIFALAVLPTTVSSCIVFTQIARGNSVVTIFNASLANVAGVFISPLLLSLLLQKTGNALPPDEQIRVLATLVLKMLLPIALGQLARLRLRKIAQRYRTFIGVFMNSSILIMIWFSFSTQGQNPSFAGSLLQLWPLVLFLALSHLLLLTAVWLVSQILRLNKASTYSALFVAPQKTLAMGAPLLSTYFASTPEQIGVTLLPLIIYHLWQLTIAGFLPRLLGPVENDQ